MDDIDRIIASNRHDLEGAIGKAKGELAACRTRCRELEARILAAEAILGISAPADAPRSGPEPTLRAAMRVVLRQQSRGLPAPEIVRRQIKDRDLYRRPNGMPVDAGQIHNRVHHYPTEFIRDGGRIRLAES